ncbi:unnamed protein product, partial [Symbiodinium sp. CCMP2592]
MLQIELQACQSGQQNLILGLQEQPGLFHRCLQSDADQNLISNLVGKCSDVDREQVEHRLEHAQKQIQKLEKKLQWEATKRDDNCFLSQTAISALDEQVQDLQSAIEILEEEQLGCSDSRLAAEIPGRRFGKHLQGWLAQLTSEMPRRNIESRNSIKSVARLVDAVHLKIITEMPKLENQESSCIHVPAFERVVEVPEVRYDVEVHTQKVVPQVQYVEKIFEVPEERIVEHRQIHQVASLGGQLRPSPPRRPAMHRAGKPAMPMEGNVSVPPYNPLNQQLSSDDELDYAMPPPPGFGPAAQPRRSSAKEAQDDMAEVELWAAITIARAAMAR